MVDARVSLLDGWRGLSILFVLAAHLLPLGPKAWDLNSSSGLLGMALFFTLSGFLITGHFLRNGSVGDFLVRRVFRILPLAWVGIFVAVFWGVLPFDEMLPHLLFYSNWPPIYYGHATLHYWSLGVEMQFYAAIAVLYMVFRCRFFWPLLFICLFVTAFRIYHDVHAAMTTYFRVDEILAGSMLAFVYYGEGRWAKKARKLMQVAPLTLLAVALFFASHSAGEWLNYLRPYLAAALVGATIVRSQSPVHGLLSNRRLVYIASISFALYVIHPFLGATWLGEGDGIDKYIKRIPLFLILWVLAHISTFYFERKFINFGKYLSGKLNKTSAKRIEDGCRIL